MNAFDGAAKEAGLQSEDDIARHIREVCINTYADVFVSGNRDFEHVDIKLQQYYVRRLTYNNTLHSPNRHPSHARRDEQLWARCFVRLHTAAYGVRCSTCVRPRSKGPCAPSRKALQCKWRGTLVVKPSRGELAVLLGTTTTAAWQGGCGRFCLYYLLTTTRTIASRSRTMRYFMNSENLTTTTSPRAHPDPDRVRAVGPGRAGAPRQNTIVAYMCSVYKHIFGS